MSEAFDCLSCGACCFGKRNYVEVFAHDVARLGAAKTEELVAAPVRLTPASVGRPAEPERYMKMVDGHCVALGMTEPNRFPCAVYETRPTLCRALEPGSGACLEARERRHVVSKPRAAS